MTAPTVSWAQALAWRVGQQLLVEPAPDLLAVVRRLAGVQAQVASSAEQAVWLRSGIGGADVRGALWKQRTLVKTWAMRGTLHWLPADELPTWIAALRDKERNIRRSAAWERYHGLSAAQLHEVTDVVGAVVGREPVTREELADAIADRTGDSALAGAVRASFGGSVLKTAAAEGLLCFGPDRGRNVTFVAPGAWVRGRWREPPADEAKRFVVERFFAAHGPATADDLARWWGVPAAEGKRLVASADDALAEVELDGQRCRVPAGELDELLAAEPLRDHVRLLPAFDAYVLAPRSHRRAAWPDGAHDRISRAAGWISASVVLDGHVVAVWQPERTRAGVTIEIEALTSLPARVRREIEREAMPYEEPLGAPLTVAWVERIRGGRSREGAGAEA